ncbi:MAG: hypothetical protein NT039_04345 [Candidatus Berkelbacteria bacterium]|nr:hypothetical protein [Candidatus Berkelbacteria bacterium]
MKKKLLRYFPFLITFIFLGLSLFNILHHELWRDEMQAWMIARDSHSLIELFKAVRFEGHPGLWYLFLFIITRFTTNPLFMQLLHIIIASISVYLFSRFSPFNLLNKFLFSFGYFAFFEYATISRNYALGVLFLIIFCLFYTRKDKNYILVALSLFFLSLTSVYGWIISFVLFLIIIKELFIDQDRRQINLKEKIISIVTITSGLTLSLFSLIPPKDFSFSPGWFLVLDWQRIKNSISIFFNGLIPVADISKINSPAVFHFWNSNILDDHPLRKFILSLTIFVVFILIFIRKRKTLFFFLASTFGIILFTYLKYFGYLRHWGHLFLIVIASFWLAEFESPTSLANNLLNKISQKIYQTRNIILTLILLINFTMGVYANWMDYLFQFSASKETAEYIAKNYSGYIYIGDKDILTMPISGYLNKKIYYFSTNDFGSYIYWNKKKRKDTPITPEEVVQKTINLKEKNGDKILLISSYPLSQDLLDKSNLKLKYSSCQTIENDEIYFIYSFS